MLPSETAPAPVRVDSFAAREAREREKAVRKYGEIALRPSGHPDYDVLDYVANELVGLVRYGEMVGARVAELADAGLATANERVAARSLSVALAEEGRRLGTYVVNLRNDLLARGVALGRVEGEPAAAPDTGNRLAGLVQGDVAAWDWTGVVHVSPPVENMQGKPLSRVLAEYAELHDEHDEPYPGAGYCTCAWCQVWVPMAMHLEAVLAHADARVQQAEAEREVAIAARCHAQENANTSIALLHDIATSRGQRIAVLEAALRPFAAIGQKLASDRPPVDADGDLEGSVFGQRVYLTAFEHAATALAGGAPPVGHVTIPPGCTDPESLDNTAPREAGA